MIVKQGYGKVESKGSFAKWKKRWIILNSSETVSEKEVLIFKTEKSAKNNEECKKIALEDIDNICIKVLSQEKHVIELEFRDDTVKRLLFALESLAKEWQEQLNLVCFGSVLGKSFKEDKGDNVSHPDETQMSDSVFELTPSKEFFPAYLQPSAKLTISGDCNLKVTSENLMVFDVKPPNIMLTSWPIRALRRFGFDATKFTVESGRRCGTGEGIFIFKTNHGEEIHNIVQSRAQLLARDSTHSTSADDNDNENFEFRPLPPLPKD